MFSRVFQRPGAPQWRLGQTRHVNKWGRWSKLRVPTTRSSPTSLLVRFRNVQRTERGVRTSPNASVGVRYQSIKNTHKRQPFEEAILALVYICNYITFAPVKCTHVSNKCNSFALLIYHVLRPVRVLDVLGCTVVDQCHRISQSYRSPIRRIDELPQSFNKINNP